jgi:hypothetical protein
VTIAVLRQVTGLPVAALFPLAIPGLRRRWWLGVLATLVYAAWTMLPATTRLLAWAAVAVTVVLAALLPFIPGGIDRASPPVPAAPPGTGSGRGLLLPIAVLALFSLIPALMLHPGMLFPSIKAVLENDKVFLSVNGAVAAVFIGGIIVGNLVLPLAEAVTRGQKQDELPELLETSTHIGWLERMLFFALFAGGAADAAALALAAKAFVRAPLAGGSKDEPLVKFYLMGTLASVGVALAAAVATRLALGLSPI